MSDWYCNSNGQQLGPMNSAALKQMAAAGQLKPTDLVWKDGMAQWSAASTVNGLFAPAPAPTSAQAPDAGGMYACSVCGNVYGIDNVYDNGGGAYICKQCHAQRTNQYAGGGTPNYYSAPYNNPAYNSGPSGGLIAMGWICAAISLIFCPPGFGIGGIVIGVNVRNKGNQGQGTAIIITSSICMILGIIIGVAVYMNNMHR